MPVIIRRIDPATREYAQDYRNGWRTSERCADGALDRADSRGVSHAWYDGYHDEAAGRPYGHLRWCTDRDRHATCWGASE